jgi:hypothetical protein
MKVRLPVLVNDPEVAQYKDIPPVDWFTVEGEDVFLDGPVCRRVAVVDFDPASGALVPGARLSDDGGVAKYDLPPGSPLDHPAFIQASVCGGIFRTLDIFEEADSLGRRVKWAFPGEQLLVVPRAGEWGNAFYERASRSLQLFYVTEPHRRVYAAHSQDIIAHETAHAILDAVAPDLYDAALPQSLAIHEAVADIAMLLSAFRSRKLTDRVREHVGDALERPNAFTQVAEQFGAVVGRGTGGIRDLNNTRTLAEVDATSPHALSEVLSGALYSVMVRIHRELLDATVDDSAPATSLASPAEYRQAAPAPETAAAPPPAGGSRTQIGRQRAFWIAAERFKRTVLRTLDYLPPGEASFVDFGRALLASDEASHPDSGEQRDWLREEFVRRGIVADAAQLDVPRDFDHAAVRGLDLDELVRSDWLAYRFVERNRELLGVPPRTPFEVRDRQDVTKQYYHRHGEGRSLVRECLLKIAWTELEDSGIGRGLPRKRRVVRGTTLAIRWPEAGSRERPAIRAIVTSRGSPGDALERDGFLARMFDEGRFRLGADACAPDGSVLRAVVRGELDGGALRVRATARALHAIPEA